MLKMEIKERQVKVGIEAPPELIVQREEIYTKNRLTARLSSESLDKIEGIGGKR